MANNFNPCPRYSQGTGISTDDKALRTHFDIAYRRRNFKPVTPAQMGLKPEKAARLPEVFQDITQVNVYAGGVREPVQVVPAYCLRVHYSPGIFQGEAGDSRRAGGERFENKLRKGLRDAELKRRKD